MSETTEITGTPVPTIIPTTADESFLAGAELDFRAKPKNERKSGIWVRHEAIPSTIWGLPADELYALSGREKPSKGTSWKQQTPEEEIAERLAKWNDHQAKLLGERAEVTALEATVGQVPASTRGAIESLLEAARRRVERRLGFISQQEAGIKKLGGTLPGATRPTAATRRGTGTHQARHTRKSA